MDPSDHYADPFGEALSYSSQRSAQLISLAVAAAQVAAHRKALSEARKAERDEQARRALREEERALFEQARAGWAPAHDPRWLAQAGLDQAAGAWGAAAAYADADPVAASAMRMSEERMRTLHPYAMTRYDRLRGEGASPLDAMRDAAPLFTREPHARPGQPGTQLRLGAATAGPDADPADGITDSSPRPSAADREAERRGQQIVSRLQARAYAERGSELDPAELATALEAGTTLSTGVITRLARARSEEQAAAGAERARAADLDRAAGTGAGHSEGEHSEDLRAARRESRMAETASARAATGHSAARLAAESFPCSAADGIRAAANGSLQQSARPSVPAAENAKRPGLSA